MGLFLTMEQGALLQQQLPLHNDYKSHPDQECINQLSTHAYHQSYSDGGGTDQFRRDGNLGHTAPSSFSLFGPATTGHSARFVPMPDRIVAAEGFQTSSNFTDSTLGPISASPSSATSSLAYTNYSANHYTGLSDFVGLVPLPQTFIPNLYASPRGPSILDGSMPSMLPPSQLHLTDSHERDMYGSSTPVLSRPHLSPSSRNSYPSYSETPRSVASAARLSLSPAAGALLPHMPSIGSHLYSAQQNECVNFPWPNLEVIHELICDGQPVTPEVHAKIEKGFFLSPSDNKWTCYRRNYFSVNCSFDLHPHIPNGRLQLKRGDQVQAMGMRLSAAVDGPQGKAIELVQHTPKRDLGPKSPIEVTKVCPTPPAGRNTGEQTMSPHGVYQLPMSTFHATGVIQGPYLPLQTDFGSSSSSSLPASKPSLQYPFTPATTQLPVPGQNTNHSFERVQFKSATANNGKRRASQQYFHLIVELFADVRRESSENANWVKVAQRVSEKIVVRGRSPSHYSNEGQHGGSSSAGRGGGTDARGSGYCNPQGGYSSNINSGGFRGSGIAYGGSMSSTTGYRTSSVYGYNPSPEHCDAHSGSSGSSNDGEPMDSGHPIEPILSESDRAGILTPEGYRYYPGAVCEDMPPSSVPQVHKIEGSGQHLPHYAVKDECESAASRTPWQFGNNRATSSRYQGVESSQGFFGNFHPTY